VQSKGAGMAAMPEVANIIKKKTNVFDSCKELSTVVFLQLYAV